MARSNLQIKVGTYTGNGIDSTNITGVGFRPDLVIVKGGANHSVIRTKEMAGDSSAYLANNVANLAGAVKELLNDGFQVGTNATTNTNGTAYYYIAIRGTAGQTGFRTGKYIGDGTDGRDFTAGGLGFTPDVVAVFADAAVNKSWRSSSMVGDTSARFSGSVNEANAIQSLISGGFQVGSITNVNQSGSSIHFFALKELEGAVAVGTYVGDGTDSRNITGIGFTPSAIFLKNADNTAQARMKTSDLAGDAAFPFGAATSGADHIQALQADGFQVGASSNNNTQNFHWIAFKAGDFNFPITRTAA